MTDFPDWQAPQAHATAIADTGAPLLTLSNTAVTNAYNLGGNGQVALPVVPITQPGYEIFVQAAGTPGTNVPFVKVNLIWRDVASNNNVATDTFIVPQSSSSLTPFVVTGYGITKANGLIVQITNLEVTQGVTGLVIVLQNSRVFPGDTWRWRFFTAGAITVPGFTTATLADDESCLGFVSSLSLPASSTTNRLFGMAPGPVRFAYAMNSGAPTDLSISMRPQPDSAYASTHITYEQAAPPPVFDVAGPRAPLLVGFKNLATTTTVVSASLFSVR